MAADPTRRMSHSMRYVNGKEEIVLTVPWGLHSGRVPPPVIEFFGGGAFVYAGDVPASTKDANT